MKTQLKDILKLPFEERILMVEYIWDSIKAEATNESFKLSDEWKDELDLRSQLISDGKTKSYTLDEMLSQIRKKA